MKFTRINQKELSAWYAKMAKEYLGYDQTMARLEKENKDNPYWNN